MKQQEDNCNNNNNNKPHRSQFYRLIEACKCKDLVSIKRIVEDRPELVNERDKHQRTLLHYATILVLDDAKSAIDENIYSRCLDCFQYLCKLSEPKLWCQVDLDGLSILHLAVISCNVPIVREIVYGHTNSIEYPLVKVADRERHSPLHWAVITNNLQCTKLLIGHSGVELAHQPDLNGATPLHYATQTSDYPKYRQQLRQMLKCATSYENSAELTGDGEQSSGGDSGGGCQNNGSSGGGCGGPDEQSLEILEYLAKLPKINLECVDNDRRTPLLWAASSGNRDAIRLLVNSGASLSCQDANKLGPLHCAASHGFTDCLECLLACLMNQTTTDERAQVQINQPDNMGCTPLFYAVLSGNIDCVELLLDKGAQRDWQDVKGRTAAHFAALRGQLNSLKLLDSRGANLWLANKQGDLPLHYAIKSGRQQVVSWLLEHSPYERAVNAINNTGRAPIHLAVMKNNVPMVSYLIGRGANLNQLVKIREKSNKSQHHTDSVDAQLALVNQSGSYQTKNGSLYHYETALDMARRLKHADCLQLLASQSAQTAEKVLSGRPPNQARASGNVRSLFDLQAADVASPIGFETSSSSAEPQGEQSLQNKQLPTALQSGVHVPRVPAGPRPVEAQISHCDSSTGSSALSQSSPTSLHEAQPGASNGKAPLGHQARLQTSGGSLGNGRAGATSGRPFKGGISYHNDRINASIKCKLYQNNNNNNNSDSSPYDHKSRSFPPLANGQHQSARQQALYHSSGSLDRATGQEIITNVNVYTSPCAHCILRDGADEHLFCGHCSLSRHYDLRANQPKRQQPVSPSTDSDSITNTTSETMTDHVEEERTSRVHLPDLGDTQQAGADYDTSGALPARPGQQRQQQQQAAPTRYLPPSQGYEQRLPAILSGEEERSTSVESNSNYEQQRAIGLEPRAPQGPREGAQLRAVSGANEEPRFDRSQRGRQMQRVDRYRDQVRSPVAEYIHAPLAQLHHRQRAAGSVEPAEPSPMSSWHQQARQADLSQVKAKVDSHRNDSGLASSHLGEFDQQHQHKTTGPRSPSRSISRQTVVRARRLSADSDELATRVEKSIWKYRQETKLFEELQNLKRSQIRSGRANEALLVKRLADHFRNDTHDTFFFELDTYRGPYTYKSYELYLYDQLRKLSQSNWAKLAGGELARSAQQLPSEEEQQQQQQQPTSVGKDRESRDYLEEDLRAELELQRVINGSPAQNEDFELAAPFAAHQMGAEPTMGSPQDLRVGKRPSGGESSERVQRETVHESEECDRTWLQDDESLQINEPTKATSSSSSSRRSSADVEREKLHDLPLQVGDKSAQLLKDALEDQASSLSSAIIVDALGNVSRASSAGSRRSSVSGGDVVRQRQAELAEEGDASSSERDYQPEDQGDDEMDQEKEFDADARTKGRRKSVVNIGNKVEIIYHDVGIEIEPVAEGNRDDDGDSEKRGQGGAVMEVDQREAEGMRQTDGATAEQAHQADRDQSAGWTGDQADGRGPLQPTGNQVSETTTSETSETIRAASGDDGALPVEKGPPEGVPTKSEPISGREHLPRRRASSPPVPLEGQPESPIQQADATGTWKYRRASESGARQVAATVSERKVFNGYDLDKLHLRRGQLKRESPVSTQVPIASTTSGSRQRPGGSPTFRRHLERSRPPKESFKIQVPLEDVRKRWAQIKRRQRHKEIRGQEGSSLLVHTKSQPNLKQSQTDDETNSTSDCSNFTLIYEINKRAALLNNMSEMSKLSSFSPTTETNELSSTRRQTASQWCQGRMRRIVDVRTLKRTLSLPESLIYSNDLLKRFNILKL